MDIATLTAERDAMKRSLEIAQTINEQNQTHIHALEGMLGEVGRLLRVYQTSHLTKDPPQPEKAQRNGDMAERIEALLGTPQRQQAPA